MSEDTKSFLIAVLANVVGAALFVWIVHPVVRKTARVALALPAPKDTKSEAVAS